MKYSFVKPQKKEIIDYVTKMWISFIVFVVIILFSFNFLIKLKTDSFKSSKSQYILKTKNIRKKIEDMEKKILFLTKEKSVAEDIYASNTILKNSIKNLFDLVPDQITLSKVIMDKKSLIIYGITPSKDTYNFLLGSPLRSIFQSSNTMFYLNDDGWYRFVSINKILDGEDGI